MYIVSAWNSCTFKSKEEGLQIAGRAPDKVHIFIPKMPISWLNPMFDLLLESSHPDDSNKRSNIGFGQEIMELASIEVYFTHIIWSSGRPSSFEKFTCKY